MKVRLDETLFKARAQENLSMTNDINKLEQVDALVECLDHFVADRKWVNEISRDELLTMVTQSNGDKEVLIESVLAKFNTPCIDTKKLKECKERRQNKGLKESMKTRKSLKESDNRDTFTLDTSNTPILNCGLYYTLLGELNPGRYDERFKEFEGCVKECAKPILDELVRETPNFEVVSVGTYYHPRYYNYETDSLEFTVKYTGNDLGTVIEEYSNNQDFIDFLQNYKSYDGFISFFADNKDDFVKQDYVKSVSQIIKYNVTEEEYDEANENLYYDVMDCGFYPEDEDDTEESLKEKKYDIYVNDKYVSSSDRYKRAKDIEDKIRKDGKIKYAGEKAIKTAGVELDELNVDAKDKLKVKRARESKKLKEEVSGKAKEFIKELKEFKQFQIDRIKENNGYDYDDIDIDFGGQDYEGCVDELIDIAQFYDREFDNLTHTIVGKIQDCVEEKMSIFEIVDYLISDCKSEFNESLKESDDKEVEKLDTFDDQMDFLAKDEQEAIDGYKKVINKVRNAKVKSQLKKIETEEKAHKDYLNKVKKNKDLEYTEPLIERKGNKCCNGKCKKANENLKEEYGNYRHSDFCSDISDELESGSTYGSVCTPYGEGCVDWQLDINGKIAEDFHCVEFLNYLLRDIAYPVRDGHLSYMGLDTIIPSDFNSDFDRKEFKHDLEMLGVYNKSSFDKFYRNKDNSYELEFWIDYDTNFDADEYEQLCDDELDSDSHFDESLKEAKGKIKIKDEIQRLVDKYSRLQKQYHGDSSASKKVEAEIDRLQCLLDMGKEYVDENLKEANDKKYFYELTDYEKKEVLGVLTSIAEFVKGDKEISTYLYKYNYQSGSTETTPISIWNESGEVSIRLDPEINSATARKIINKIKKQFDTKELWVYYDKSDGSLPPEIVIKYLNDGKNENLKEADNLQTRATKMLSVKKYQIDLAWKNGKTWKTDPMTLDEISKSVGARVTEKQFVDMMSDNIKGRKDAKNLTKAEIVKLYDYMDGKWKGKEVLWSIKGKTKENLSGGCGRKKTSKRAK